MNQLPYLLPWIRVALLIRSIRTTTFDEATWPTVKTVLARALAMRGPTRARELVELTPAARRAALGFLHLSPGAPELRLLHGIG